MIYPQEVIDEVRALNDIVEVVGSFVSLRPRSGNHFALCPFHNEKSPSFSVNADKQIFYCFGCGVGGNVISFVMRIENYDFLDALKWLADRVHYTLPQPTQTKAIKKNAQLKERIAEINQKAARFFYDRLQEDTQEARMARDYLDVRGINAGLRVRFGLGLSPAGWDGLATYLKGLHYTQDELHQAGLIKPNKNQGFYDRFRDRLMFPIIDLHNRVIGFGGRIIDKGEPKYLNSPETPLFDKSRQLYGLSLARKAKADEILIVEGYMDVIGLHQAGFANTVGVLGTALTAEHTRLLRRASCQSVVLLMDSDPAGTTAALRAIPILLAGGLKVKVLQVTDAKDPDEYIQSFGAKQFARQLQAAQSHIAFRVGLLRKQYDINNTEQRIAFTQQAAQVLATLSSTIETDAYAGEIAASTGISQAAILAEVQKQRGKNGTTAPLRPPRARTSMGNQRHQKGLWEARKGLLNLITSNPMACHALKQSKYLSPEEMGDELCQTLMQIVFDADEKSLVHAADLIARFQTVEEQQKVAEILNRPQVEGEAEKNLNDMASVVKRAWLENQKDLHSTDLNIVKMLHERMKTLQTQYITMPNG
jgi:DNA primase